MCVDNHIYIYIYIYIYIDISIFMYRNLAYYFFSFSENVTVYRKTCLNIFIYIYTDLSDKFIETLKTSIYTLSHTPNPRHILFNTFPKVHLFNS